MPCDDQRLRHERLLHAVGLGRHAGLGYSTCHAVPPRCARRDDRTAQRSAQPRRRGRDADRGVLGVLRGARNRQRDGGHRHGTCGRSGDGIGVCTDHRRAARRAGHQRDRYLPVRLGVHRPVVPEAGRYTDSDSRASADRHPRAVRHPVHRRDLLPTQPADLCRLPVRACCVVHDQPHHVRAEYPSGRRNPPKPPTPSGSASTARAPPRS